MTNNIFETIKIYEITDSNPEAITVDPRFRNLTITVQPLTLPVEVLPQDYENDGKPYLKEEYAISAASMAGTVTLKAMPPNSFHEYALPDNVIDLSTPHFISTGIPMKKLFPTFTTIVGSTHIAVSVTGFEA